MRMIIYDNYYEGVQFYEDPNGDVDVPDDIAIGRLNAERDYRDAQDEARGYL